MEQISKAIEALKDEETYEKFEDEASREKFEEMKRAMLRGESEDRLIEAFEALNESEANAESDD